MNTIRLTGDEILQNSPNMIEWVLIILATISGVVGGCGAASKDILSGRDLTIAIIAAYGTLGGALGLFSFVVLEVFTNASWQLVSVVALALGFGGTASLAAVRIGIRAFLKWRGIEVDVEVRRTRKEEE